MYPDDAFAIDTGRVDQIAQLLRTLAYAAAPYRPLSDLHVPDPRRHIANFIFFMVAIDHDTQREGIRYESRVDGRVLHGSDLLYALAERAKISDVGLFLADRFADITDAEVATLFTTDAGVVPHDVRGRAEIFRTCAAELRAEYGGDVLNLIAASNDRAGGPAGLFARLAPMAAYADPTSKKANLLRKLLKRAALFKPTDPEAWDIASDHVVMTMALRSGLIRCTDAAFAENLKAGTELEPRVITLLRHAAKQALKALATRANVDVDDIDDLFWAYGRKALREATPLPDASAVHCDLDGAVDPAARPVFVAALNGLDEGAPTTSKQIRVVRGPFTRDY